LRSVATSCKKAILKPWIQPQFGKEPLETLFAASHDQQLSEYKSVERFIFGGCLGYFA
jgi:hypothetical protein